MKKIILSLFLFAGIASAATLVKNKDVDPNAAISLSKLQTITNNSVLGNVSGGTGVPTTLNGQQLYSLISSYVSGVHSSLTGLTADDHPQYYLLAGRTAGQTLVGGTNTRASVFIQPSSTGTGSVYMATKPGDSVIMGPLGAFTNPAGVVEILTPATSGGNNGLIVRENSRQSFSAQSGTTNAAGWAILPQGPSGEPELRCSSKTGSSACYWRQYDTGFGNLYGYILNGPQPGVMNSGTSFVPWRISGTTGQSADLTTWSNTNDFGTTVAGVDANGRFKAAAGTLSAMSYGLYGTTGVGMYFPGTGSVAIAVGGADKVHVNSSGLRIIGAGAGTLVTDSNGQVSVGSSGTSLAYALKTSSYTMTNSDDVVVVNCSSPGCTITLHAASGATSKMYHVKNIGTGSVAIARSGSDTIDGDTSYILMPAAIGPFPAVSLIPNGGSAWYAF